MTVNSPGRGWGGAWCQTRGDNGRRPCPGYRPSHSLGGFRVDGLSFSFVLDQETDIFQEKPSGFEQWHSSLQGTRAAGRVESSFGLSARRRALWLSTLFLSPNVFLHFWSENGPLGLTTPSTLVPRSRPGKHPGGRPHQWDGLEFRIALPFPSCGAGEEPRRGASSSRLPRTQRPALRPSEKPALPSAATGQAPWLSVLPAAALVTWASGTSF